MVADGRLAEPVLRLAKDFELLDITETAREIMEAAGCRLLQSFLDVADYRDGDWALRTAESLGIGTVDDDGFHVWELAPENSRSAAELDAVLGEISTLVGRITGGRASIVAAPMLFDKNGNYVAGAYIKPDWRQDTSTPESYYSRSLGRSIIAVALNDAAGRPLPPEEIRRRARHEVMHFLVDRGVLPSAAWAVLAANADHWRAAYNIDELYRNDGLSEAQLTEEAACEAFARWAAEEEVLFSPPADIPFAILDTFYDRVRTAVEQQAIGTDPRYWFSLVEAGIQPDLIGVPSAPVFLAQQGIVTNDETLFSRNDLFGTELASAPLSVAPGLERHRGALIKEIAGLAIRFAPPGAAGVTERLALEKVAKKFALPASAQPLLQNLLSVMVTARRARAGSELSAGLQYFDTKFTATPNMKELIRDLSTQVPGPDGIAATRGRSALGLGSAAGRAPADVSASPPPAPQSSGTPSTAGGDLDIGRHSLPYLTSFVGAETFPPEEIAPFLEILNALPESRRAFIGSASPRLLRLMPDDIRLLGENDRLLLDDVGLLALNGTTIYLSRLPTADALDHELMWLAAPHLNAVLYDRAYATAQRRGSAILQHIRGNLARSAVAHPERDVGALFAPLSHAASEVPVGTLADARSVIEAVRTRIGRPEIDLQSPPQALLDAARQVYPTINDTLAILSVHAALAPSTHLDLTFTPARDAIAVAWARDSVDNADVFYGQAGQLAPDRAALAEARTIVEAIRREIRVRDVPPADLARLIEQETTATERLEALSDHVQARRPLFSTTARLEQARADTQHAHKSLLAILEEMTSHPLSPYFGANGSDRAEWGSSNARAVTPDQRGGYHVAPWTAVPPDTASLWNTLRHEFPRARFAFSNYQAHGRRHFQLQALTIPEGERGLGMGSAILYRLREYAHHHGMNVVASPGIHHGLRVADQQRFLQKAGFVLNVGSSASADIRGLMHLPAPTWQPVAGASVQSAEGAPTISGGLRARLVDGLATLREYAAGLTYWAATDLKAETHGRHEADYHLSMLSRVKAAQALVAEFREAAEIDHFNAEAIFVEMGGYVEALPSDEAAQWLVTETDSLSVAEYPDATTTHSGDPGFVAEALTQVILSPSDAIGVEAMRDRARRELEVLQEEYSDTPSLQEIESRLKVPQSPSRQLNPDAPAPDVLSEPLDTLDTAAVPLASPPVMEVMPPLLFNAATPVDPGVTHEVINPIFAPSFTIASQGDLAPAGAMAKVDANLHALRLLSVLQQEQRPATPDEQAVLARYSGWGHAPNVFDLESDARWRAAGDALREMLPQDAYRQARATVLNAHYTSVNVIREIWAGVEAMGFTGGSVLEPGCGIGNFIGTAPAGARFTGIELDGTTAAIAQALYPSATIRAIGFQDITLPVDHFDLVVGNVPFGKFTLHDPRHNPGRHSIHNHFIVKSLALAKPGAVVAVITSRYTLDARNPAARRDMADTADLIGAIRLPETAFRANAGTSAVTDILFLRKRLPDEAPLRSTWTTATLSTLGHGLEGDAATEVYLNTYFQDHPEQILGALSLEQGMHGAQTLTVKPRSDLPLGQQLREAVERVVEAATAQGRLWSPMVTKIQPGGHMADLAPADVKEGAFYLGRGGMIRRRMHGIDADAGVPVSAQQEVRKLIELRDLANTVLSLQLLAASGDDTEPWANAQRRLNATYDQYVAKYGPINRYTPINRGRDEETGEDIVHRRYPKFGGFRRDADFPTLLALELFDEETQTAQKAAIFTQRVINQPRIIRGADDARGALLAVLAEKGRVDLEAIADLTSSTVANVAIELRGFIFHDPAADMWVTADAYLSGNVRQRLAEARAVGAGNTAYALNIEALERVQPRDLMPSEISVRLGAPWVPAADIEAFANDLLHSTAVRVTHVPSLALWKVRTTDNRDKRSVPAVNEWGTDSRPFLDLLDSGLNGRAVTVYDVDSDGTRVRNLEATLAANEKLDKIQEHFAQWIWQDPERSDRLCRSYNDTFNALVLRNFDGNHLTFPSMAANITLDTHQKAAVWRGVQTGNTLVAHVVGAGKTFTSIAIAMESRRFGLINKPVFAVPNHMLEQFSREFKQLYPRANLLVADKEEVSPANRKLFVAKAAMGDWDAVIMTHRAFETIPLSKATQAKFLEIEKQELEDALTNGTDEDGSRHTVKRLEAAKIRLEEQIESLVGSHDDGLEFELTGIDQVFVDELHLYKNLYFPTRIEGAAPAASKRAQDLFMKVQYLEEVHPGRSLCGMTGTPIANKVAEMFTMQRYFDLTGLRARSISRFDAWAANFGTAVTALELAPDGSSYRMSTRFARYRNVPDLLVLFRQFADVQTAEQLQLKTPALAGGRPRMRVVPASPILQAYIGDIKERMETIRNGTVDPQDDNMLKICGDGRRAALDLRLVGLEDPAGGGKLDAVVEEVVAIYERTKDWQYPARGGGMQSLPGALQLIFCDLGTPKNDGTFDVYSAMRDDMVERGIPRDRVRFIHDYATDEAKARLFRDCRGGKVSVLFGSTEKMGVGTNVQDRLYALHHVDCPWRPCDIEQRDGRQVRQGNLHYHLNIAVENIRYGTEGSFDVYMWQGAERKQSFIAQIMRGDLTSRDIEEIDGAALSYAEAKAVLTGNPLIMEKATVDAEVGRLERLHRTWQQDQSHMRWRLQSVVTGQASDRAAIGILERRIAQTVSTAGEQFQMTVDGRLFDNRKKAGTTLLSFASRQVIQSLETKAGHQVTTAGLLGGFKVLVVTGGKVENFHAAFRFGDDTPEDSDFGSYEIDFKERGNDAGENALSLVRSLEGTLQRLPEALRRKQDALAEKMQLEADLTPRLGLPFEHDERLTVLHARKAEIDKALSADPAPVQQSVAIGEVDDEQRRPQSLPIADERKAFSRTEMRSYEAGVGKFSDFVRNQYFDYKAFLSEATRAAEKENRPRALGLAHAYVAQGAPDIDDILREMGDGYHCSFRERPAFRYFLIVASTLAGRYSPISPEAADEQGAWKLWSDSRLGDYLAEMAAAGNDLHHRVHSRIIDEAFLPVLADAINRLPDREDQRLAKEKLLEGIQRCISDAADEFVRSCSNGRTSFYAGQRCATRSPGLQRDILDALPFGLQATYLEAVDAEHRERRHSYYPGQQTSLYRPAENGHGLRRLVTGLLADTELANEVAPRSMTTLREAYGDTESALFRKGLEDGVRMLALTPNGLSPFIQSLLASASDGRRPHADGMCVALATSGSAPVIRSVIAALDVSQTTGRGLISARVALAAGLFDIGIGRSYDGVIGPDETWRAWSHLAEADATARDIAAACMEGHPITLAPSLRHDPYILDRVLKASQRLPEGDALRSGRAIIQALRSAALQNVRELLAAPSLDAWEQTVGEEALYPSALRDIVDHLPHVAQEGFIRWAGGRRLPLSIADVGGGQIATAARLAGQSLTPFNDFIERYDPLTQTLVQRLQRDTELATLLQVNGVSPTLAYSVVEIVRSRAIDLYQEREARGATSPGDGDAINAIYAMAESSGVVDNIAAEMQMTALPALGPPECLKLVDQLQARATAPDAQSTAVEIFALGLEALHLGEAILPPAPLTQAQDIIVRAATVIAANPVLMDAAIARGLDTAVLQAGAETSHSMSLSEPAIENDADREMDD